MVEKRGVEVDLDLDGKLLHVQFRSEKEYKSQVVNEFLAVAEAQAAVLELAEGMRREAVRLKRGDEFTDKWLVTLHVEAKELGEGAGKHYDFENSKAFYVWVKREGKKSERDAKLRLVYDECSDSRADVLYPIVKDIEREFRVLALKLGIELGDSVQSRKTGEHLICNVETSQLFGVYFMRPASDKYYLKKLAEAETDEQRLVIRDLTIADEIGFSEFKHFLEKMHTVRNPVMHGRYITEADFQSSLTMLKKIRKKLDHNRLYDALVINDEFIKSIAEMAKAMSGMTEMIQKSMAPTMSAINTMVAGMTQTKELAAQMSDFAKKLYGPGGIITDLSKIDVTPIVNAAIPVIPPIITPTLSRRILENSKRPKTDDNPDSDKDK